MSKSIRLDVIALGLVPGLVLAGLVVGCAGPTRQTENETADVVFVGEHILTVDARTAGANAVAIRGDAIVAVGERDELLAWVGEHTRIVELGDSALAPGFIDAHGHLSGVMQTLDLVNVSSPPVGKIHKIDDIVDAMRARIDDDAIAAGIFVMGYGYDDSLLAEGRHPNRDDLDRVSLEHPIGLLHVSGHLATANSAALAFFGIEDGTPNPPGGVIRRRAGGQVPNGVLEETAAIGAIAKLIGSAAPSPEKFAADLFRSISYHANFGITTIQDGASSPAWMAGVRAVAARQALPIDVAGYLNGNQLTDESSLEALGFSRDYENGVRMAGVKFVLDGSPQGRTAWMTRPYDEGPSGQGTDYVAYPIIDPDQYMKQAARLIHAGIPILAHANGDAAIDLMIEGVDRAVGDKEIDHRSVAIHAQLAREDQLDAMKRLGIVPSFFAAHPFFWGDWHRKSFGDDRAMRISPMRSARDRGIPFTIHNDAPIVPPNIMLLIEIAVERRTRSGFVLGVDQRVSVEEALRSVTLDAAYAYFEEDRKGSISVGKRADLVVLAADPRMVAPAEISEIGIVETFSRGQSVYLNRQLSK